MSELKDVLEKGGREYPPEPTAQEVRDAAKVIDGQFSSWYGQIRDPPGLIKTLDEAEKVALRDLERLFLNSLK